MVQSILFYHGITDLVEYPLTSMMLYGSLTSLVATFPWKTKAGLLMAASVYHLRNDVPGGVATNIAMNAFWVKRPASTEVCLTRQHVHNLPHTLKEKLFWVGLMTIATVADMAMRWSTTFPDLWWVGPALAHVMLENLHHGKKCEQIGNGPCSQRHVGMKRREE